MRSPLIPALAALLASTAAAAHAQGGAQASDIRCMLTMGALASVPANKEAALLGVYFYAGRITAREPDFDFAGSLKPIAAKMNGQQVHESAKPCAAEVAKIFNALKAAQSAMTPPQPNGAPAPK